MIVLGPFHVVASHPARATTAHANQLMWRISLKQIYFKFAKFTIFLIFLEHFHWFSEYCFSLRTFSSHKTIYFVLRFFLFLEQYFYWNTFICSIIIFLENHIMFEAASPGTSCWNNYKCSEQS